MPALSALPVANAPDGTEIVPLVQSGTTKRTTVAAFLASRQALAEKDEPGGYPGLNAQGFVVPGQLGSGTRDGSKFLRDDGTWQVVPGGGGGGAPTDAPYVVGQAVDGLSAELVLGAKVVRRGVFTGMGAAGVLPGQLYDTTDEEQFVWRDAGQSWEVFAIKGLAIQEDGVAEGAGVRTLNVGSGLDVAVAGEIATLSAPGGGGGGMLATPVHFSLGSVFSITTALADVDATNLAITFTAPANGKVRILVNTGLIVSASSTKAQLAIREGGATVGPLQNCLSNVGTSPGTGTENRARATAVWIITGLSAGQHTYKLAAQMATGTGNITTDVTTIEAWPVP